MRLYHVSLGFPWGDLVGQRSDANGIGTVVYITRAVEDAAAEKMMAK